MKSEKLKSRKTRVIPVVISAPVSVPDEALRSLVRVAVKQFADMSKEVKVIRVEEPYQ